jgi:hypothetical protein
MDQDMMRWTNPDTGEAYLNQAPFLMPPYLKFLLEVGFHDTL